MEFEELQVWLRLTLIEGVGNAAARSLLAAFGLPENIFEQSTEALSQVVSQRQSNALHQEPPELHALLKTTWQWLQADLVHRRVLPLGHPEYPQCLLLLEDPPLLLYALGSLDGLADGGRSTLPHTCLAMVGSRNPTPQGLENARQFARALTEAGLIIVSGLALGIDGASHEGALEGASAKQLATIAVVGTGLDRVYPKPHFDLAHRIAQRGVLLSEYPLGTPPLSNNFPRRNRIISGLSCGTLVVEAALKSGSLITARLAAEQGKEVFAIPGSIHSTQARGCHALIKQGAKLVECGQDVLEELHIGSRQAATTLLTAPSTTDTSGIGDVTTEDKLLDAIGFDPVGLDALQARTGMDTPSLQAHLMGLELQQRIARLPGGLFQRLLQA